MHTVYILYSFKDKKLYVGRTTDLYRRLGQHFRGEVKATQHRLPLKLIGKETFKTVGEAAQRERFLKSLYGSKVKKKILEEFLKLMSTQKMGPRPAHTSGTGRERFQFGYN